MLLIRASRKIAQRLKSGHESTGRAKPVQAGLCACGKGPESGMEIAAQAGTAGNFFFSVLPFWWKILRYYEYLANDIATDAIFRLHLSQDLSQKPSMLHRNIEHASIWGCK